MLYFLAVFLYVVVCFVLMLVVLLQQGKGGDIASAFGGGTSQAAFGARSGATVLSRATTVCAVLFMVGAIVLGILGQRGPSSVIGGRAPVQTPATPSSSKPVMPSVPGQPSGAGSQSTAPKPASAPESGAPAQAPTVPASK
jgi:preprotein translocase subunit SecG